MEIREINREFRSFPGLIRMFVDETIEATFKPDHYSLDHEHQIVYLIEDVHWNDLSTNKLRKLAKFWADCDCYDWDVKLTVNHIYGTSVELDLAEQYYKLLQSQVVGIR